MIPRLRRRSDGDGARSAAATLGGRDDRAVSITVNYVIALGITAVLISGLLIAGGSYVATERDQVVREELDVVGEQVAAGLEDADRLSRATDATPDLRVGVGLPDRVAGESYRIEIIELAAPGAEPGRYEVRLRSVRSNVAVALTITTLVPIEETAVNGGWLVIELDAGAGPALVVSEGDGTDRLSLSRPSADVAGIESAGPAGMDANAPQTRSELV